MGATEGCAFSWNRPPASSPQPPARFLAKALIGLACLCAFPLAARAQAVPDPVREAPAPAPTPPPVITPPQLTGDPVLAGYPPAALAQGRAARVVLEIDLDATGAVKQGRIVSPPQPGFDESALAAMQRLRFTPARSGDQPIPVRLQFAFNFAAPENRAAAPQQALEKPVNLAGTVRERGTRKKLSGIEVLAPASGLSAFTDPQGRFELHGVPDGQQEIVIAAPGYQRFSVKEQIDPGQKLEVAYSIEALYSSPYEATVEGTRQRKEISKTTISIEEVNRIPGAQGDALKVIEDLPGVARTSPIGGGLLVVRGSKPGDSLVFLDGEPILLLYHFGALSSTVNPDLLEGIDFIPGNFSASYGDMTGGLVQVRTRPLREEFHGYANFNLLEASALVEGAVPGVPGLTLALAGRRSYIDIILRAALSGNGDVGLTAAPVYYDAQLRFDYRPPGSRHSFQFLALTSDDKLGLLLKRPADADPNVSGSIDAETGFSQLRLKHGYHDGPFSLDTVFMFERLDLSFGVGAQIFAFAGYSFFLRSTASLDLADALGLSFGVDLVNRRLRVQANVSSAFLIREGEFNQDAPPRADSDRIVQSAAPFNRASPGLWAEARWKPLPGLTLTPGVRFDAYRYTDQPTLTSTLTARLSARWELSDRLTLKAGLGSYSQGARNGDAAPNFGNPNVLPERAVQGTLGIEARPLSGVFFGAESFYKKLDDLTVRAPAGTYELNGKTYPTLLDNAGVGAIYGVEVLLRKELTDRLFGWVAYTFSRSVRTDRPGLPQRLFDFDQTHNLTMIGSYKLPRGWQFGVRLRLISGNPDTPIVGARYLAVTDTYLPLFGLANSARLPAFHQLDARLDKVWTFDSWQLDAYLDVLNVYNHRAIEGTLYNYDFSQRAFFQGLPIIPSVGLKGSF